MYLSVREHISITAGPIFVKLFAQIPPCRGSVLLWRRCATLRTSGFIDYVKFDCNGRDAETWKLQCAATAMSGVAIPGRSLMSMNTCLALYRIELHCVVLSLWLQKEQLRLIHQVSKTIIDHCFVPSRSNRNTGWRPKSENTCMTVHLTICEFTYWLPLM